MKKTFTTIVGVFLGLIFIFLMIGVLAPRDYENEMSRIIQAPNDRVWEYLLDIEDIPNRRPEIVRIELLGKNEQGLTTWKEHTNMGGFALFERTDMEPRTKITLTMTESSFGMTGSWSYLLDGDERSTQVTITEKSRIDNVPVRAIMTLFGRDSNLKTEFRLIEEALFE